MQLQETQESATTVRTTWLRLTKIGAGGFIVWAVALQLGSGFFDPIVTALAVVYAGFLRSVSPKRRPWTIALLAFATLTMAVNVLFGIYDLLHPESPGSFAPQLFVTLAIGLAIFGAVGHLSNWSPGTARAALASTSAVLAVGLIVSLLLSAAAPSDDPLADDLVVNAEGFAWVPGRVAFDTTSSSGLWVNNRDIAHHSFAVPELGIEIQIPASKARRVQLTGAAPGDYQFVCTVPGHESMTGTLTVTG